MARGILICAVSADNYLLPGFLKGRVTLLILQDGKKFCYLPYPGAGAPYPGDAAALLPESTAAGLPYPAAGAEEPEGFSAALATETLPLLA